MVNKLLSYGVELELADVDCFKDIPSDIGSWESGNKKNINGAYIGSETCIMNSDGTACDPSKLTVTKGGEIHVVPSYSIDTLMDRIKKIFEIFPEAKMFLPGKMHIHVGIKDYDLNDIKNIYHYMKYNDKDLMDAMCPEAFMTRMLNDPKVPKDLSKHYLSSRRTITNPKCFDKIDDFDTLKELRYWWGTRGMYYFPKPVISYNGELTPSKQNIRVQSLHVQHILCHNTIEYRNFASTTDIQSLHECLLLAKRFTEEALKGYEGTPLKDYISEYNLPEWEYDADVISKWWEYQLTQPAHTAGGGSGKKFHEFEVV